MDERITPEQCIFCKIVKKEAPAHVVRDDARTLVFMDLFPAADGHVLVIPKHHAINLLDCEDADLAAIGPLSRRVARAMRKVFAPDGIGVFQLNGAAAGQTVWHYHLHLIPRRVGEPMTLHGRAQGDPARLASNAAQLAEALEDAGKEADPSRPTRASAEGARSEASRAKAGPREDGRSRTKAGKPERERSASAKARQN